MKTPPLPVPTSVLEFDLRNGARPAGSRQQRPTYPHNPVSFSSDGHYVRQKQPAQPPHGPTPSTSAPRNPPSYHPSMPTSAMGAPSPAPGPGPGPPPPCLEPGHSEIERQMHTKYLENRGEWLSSALANAEDARQRLAAQNAQTSRALSRCARELKDAREEEGRLRAERDQAVERLRTQHDEAWAQQQQLHSDVAHDKAALQQQLEALRGENAHLKGAMRRFARGAQAHFAQMRAQLAEAKVAPPAEHPEPPIKSEPVDALSVVPQAKTELLDDDALDLQYPPPPPPGSTFYMWEAPPAPAADRKRPRTPLDQDEERAAQRPRLDSRSEEISMGPAFPIPRELNFDVKTLTSPVCYFELRRHKCEGD